MFQYFHACDSVDIGELYILNMGQVRMLILGNYVFLACMNAIYECYHAWII